MLLLFTNMKRRADSTSKPSPLGNRPWKKFPTFLALDLHDPNKLNGDEGQLFRSLEATVFRYLKPVPLEVATDPVGLDESIGDFESFMESKQQNANKKVKIVGLGGSGKKTLPKEYFSGRRPLFERSSFLLGLRDASNRNALPGLQSWLLQDLSHVNDFKFDSVSEGMGIIRERLQSSTPRMFIVLDNIDHPNQVEAVLVEDVLRSGCLIIVTSREEGALEFLEAAPIYHIKQLRAKHAQYLFCKQAFQQFCPMCGFEKLVEKFCERCGGLPLFLKVMWAHLRISANDRDHWEDKLKHRPHKEKQILSGVACFFLGEDKSLAIKMWDKCEGRGLHRLKNIENNCLVEFDDEYCFKMHDHLRDFGREIANKDSPCRLWNESQAANFREQHTNMSPWLRWFECPHTEQHTNMSPWLRWFECPHTNISPWLMSMRNLTVLKLLCGDLQEWLLCDEQVHLRELRIVRTILFMVSIPQNVCPCLEHLDLHCNIKLVEVKHLPQKLVKLNLNICTNIQELQGLKPLRQLRSLNISECSELSELPKLQHLTSLEGLYASDCTKLQHIHGLEHLSQLRDLNICRCSELSKLPKLLHLTSLETLDASACTNLQHTQGLKHLPRFRDLNISRCSELCTNLFMVSIPQNVFPRLEHLDLHCNIKLVEVKHLPQKLIKLNLNICTNIQELQGLKPLRQLRYLNISECSELSELPKLQHLTSLEGLYASDCTKLQHIHGLEHLPQLRDLNICRCSELPKLPKLQHLTSLETLDASGCANLQHKQGLEHLPQLQALNFSRCSKLRELPKLQHLTSLERLHASDCANLQNIRGLEHLLRLRYLNICRCSELRELPKLQHLPSLETLNASGCTELQRKEDLEHLPKL